MGFTFDDSGNDGDANPIALMNDLIRKNPRNAERIFPYIGGEEVNDSPTHAHRRYVINFGDMPESEARRWPDLMAIVEEKVKPERLLKPGSYSKEWWLFGRRNQEGQLATRGLDRVLVCPIISNKLSFTFLPARMVYSHKLAIFPLITYAAFVGYNRASMKYGPGCSPQQ